MSSGHEAEFSAFVAARSPALYRSAYFLTGGDRLAAQDLVQDSLAAAYIRWRSIRDPNAHEAFVRKIMVRAATRRWDKLRRTREDIGATPPEVPQPGHEEAVTSTWDLTQALSRLSPKQRAVIVLRYFHDMSEAQIADALGCSTGAVKSHASRGIKALGLTLDGTPYAPTFREGP